MNSTERRELIELWLLAGEGAADEAQLERLSRWLESDGEARACALDVARQQGWLAWNAAEMRLPAAFEALLRAVGEELPAAAPALEVAPSRPVSGRRPNKGATTQWAWWAVAASLLGFIAGQWFSEDRPGARQDEGHSPLVQATMVSSTGCLWGPGNALGAPADRGFSRGDSLQLLEGIAEFRIGGGAEDVRLQMEGPASLVLTAQGTASMSYGKIIIKTGALQGRAYIIETSFGRVLVEPRSEIGLIGVGSTAELHCFRGHAAIESPWLQSDEQEVASESLAAGEALAFNDIGGAALEASRGAAEEVRFTPQVSMSTDFLSVSSDYVRQVVAAKPVAYWRFEQPPGAVIPNEMGEAYHGRVKGEVGWAGPEGNRSVELGLKPNPGSIVAAESWDQVLSGDFSIELWMKPSHHHLGSMVGFVGEFDPVEQRNKHGVLLATCGPSGPNDWVRMNEIRFLHRSQLTANREDGVSCFSGKPYDARRWQHVAAVKEGGKLRLYLNGELLQTVAEDQPTPAGLQLVIGQLYTETAERFFVGQLDEVAIYDRALKAAEVAEHYQLLRPAAKEEAAPAPAA